MADNPVKCIMKIFPCHPSIGVWCSFSVICSQSIVEPNDNDDNSNDDVDDEVVKKYSGVCNSTMYVYSLNIR